MRGLKVHEYAGMEVMSQYGINVPNNGVASTMEEVNQVLQNVIGGFLLLFLSSIVCILSPLLTNKLVF